MLMNTTNASIILSLFRKRFSYSISHNKIYIRIFPNLGHREVAQALIELGANVLAKNTDNQTPRETAEYEGEI